MIEMDDGVGGERIGGVAAIAGSCWVDAFASSSMRPVHLCVRNEIL